MWENMGRYLENFSPPMVWNFTPEQLQDPDEVTECLQGGKKKIAVANPKRHSLPHCAGP